MRTQVEVYGSSYRLCPRCKEESDVFHFVNTNDNADKLCRSCFAVYYIKKDDPARTPHTVQIIDEVANVEFILKETVREAIEKSSLNNDQINELFEELGL